MKTIALISVCFLLVLSPLVPGSRLFAQLEHDLLQEAWPEFGASRHWQSGLMLKSDSAFYQLWDIDIGEGRSQVVGASGSIYVLSGSSSETAEGGTRVVTKVFGINARTGGTDWSYEHMGLFREKQQTFGGAMASPQATPCINGNRLIVVTFTGQLICLNRSSGKLLWEKDLVDDFGGEPVRYGFSSSPVSDPSDVGRIIVQAFGKEGGLLCLNALDGSLIWKSNLTAPSYSTPVTATLGGVNQWLVVTQLEFAGIEMESGRQLWRHDLVDAGLTMVATPLVVDQNRIMVSGQGCRGTRCFSVLFDNDSWQVTENWYARRLEYYYTNWIKVNNRVALGANDQFLAAFDIDDGAILAKWRGFEDGNVIQIGEQFLIVDKVGKVSLLRPNTDGESFSGVTVNAQVQIGEGRVWTAPSGFADKLFVRSGGRLYCLISRDTGGLTPVPSILESPEIMVLDENPDRATIRGRRRRN